MNTNVPKINLLAKQKRRFDQQSAVALKAKIWSGTALVAYVVVLVIAVSFNVYLSQRARIAQDALDRAKMSLTSSTVIIRQHEKAVIRADTIEMLLNQRRESIELWQQLQQMLPEGTELSSFALEGSLLSASVIAPNVLIANQVVDMVENDISALGVKKSTVDIVRSDDASYKLTFELLLNSIEVEKS